MGPWFEGTQTMKVKEVRRREQLVSVKEGVLSSVTSY